MSEPVYHVEVRQFPSVARAFNLSRRELESRIVAPWRAGRAVELDDRRWDPGKARLSIYAGRALAPEELGLGRGWGNATRTGEEVTERVLAEPSAVEGFKAELPERIALADVVARAGARYPRARVSERLALAEQAVWELLHERRMRLTRSGRPLAREDWAVVLLRWQTWTSRELWLERPSGDDVGDQPLAF